MKNKNCNLHLIELLFFISAALGWEFYQFGNYLDRYQKSGVLPPDSFEAAVADGNIAGALKCSPILMSLFACIAVIVLIYKKEYTQNKISEKNMFVKKDEEKEKLLQKDPETDNKSVVCINVHNTND